MNLFNKIRNNQNGVSIVEVTVVVSVIAIMMIVLSATFIIQLRLTNVMTALSQMQNNRSIIFGLVQEQIHLANQILPLATVNGVNFTTNETTLVMTIPSVDESNSIIADTFDSVAIYQNPSDFSQLLFDLDADTASSRPDVQERILTNDLDVIQFGYNAAQPELSPSVYVHMVLSRNVLGITRSIPFDTFLILKNL